MIGMNFKVNTNKLDKIKKENMDNADRCLTAVIAEWLTNPQGIIPNWELLVMIIGDKCGGDNPHEASRVAEQHRGSFAPGSWIVAATADFTCVQIFRATYGIAFCVGPPNCA